jgi:hypothetical protein
MPLLKPLHLAVGLLGLIAFVLTGQYMGMFLGGLEAMPDGPRLLYRTSHLYLMWASLVNLLVGAYFVTGVSRGARIGQSLASALLLLSPPLMLTGFFLESPANNLDRVFCSWGNYFALAGVILHIASSLLRSKPAG